MDFDARVPIPATFYSMSTTETPSPPTELTQAYTPSTHIDPETARLLASPPFLQVEGVYNLRDFGGYSTSSSATVRKNYAFRSGEINASTLSETGKEGLVKSGVKKVFDLRSKFEIAKFGSGGDGIWVERVWCGVQEDLHWDERSLRDRLEAFEKDELSSFLDLYSGMLEEFGPSYEKILVHIRDRPSDPFLVHCTAGKDRTGVFVAVLLMLLGVSDEDIASEHALTTIGLKPLLPILIKRAEKDPMYKERWKGALNMGQSRPETMLATLKMIREKYGSAEGYLKKCTTLGDEDFVKIRTNMLIQTGAN